MILLHGFPDNAYTWQNIMTRLAAEGFHAVAVFNRGYYPTDIPANRDYSVATMADDVSALIDKFGEKKAVLIGQDWGALIAYAVANKNPGAINKLVTVAVPHPRFFKPTLSFLRTVSHILVFQFGALSAWYTRRNNYAYLDQLYRRWSPTWFPPQYQLKTLKDDFSRPGRLEAAINYYCPALVDVFSNKKSRVYKKVTSVPTLLFVGDQDPLYRLGLFSNNETAFSDSFAIVVVPHSGHFLHRDRPDIFIQKTIEFLKQ